MRNIQKLIAFVFVFIACSCTSDDLSEITSNDDKISITPKNGTVGGQNNTPVYSQTSLIVQFKTGTTDPQKAGIRGANGVNNYEQCHCTNKDIELWHFGGVINVEPKRRAIKGQIDNESTTGLEAVDYEFVFGLDIGSPYIGTDVDTGYISYIKEENSGITIAVLDTGLATGLTVFNDGSEAIQFLYDATDTAVGDEKSGWDFVSEDANTFDDDTGKHGSIIANMITSALRANAIPHQILPVKVSNSSGETSYFNFLCGSLYALERADILSISMGWYDDGFGDSVESIFSNIVETNPNVIIVTSAGNSENNNDETSHFPSSYEHNNIIVVASSNQGLSKISDFSNFGFTSVDYFAKGEGIPFYDVFVQGTSFAAPQVTIQVANLFDELGILTPEELKDELGERGTPVSGSFTFRGGEYRNAFYNKLIIPFD